MLQFPFDANDKGNLKRAILGSRSVIPGFLSSDAQNCITKVRVRDKKDIS